MTNIKLQSIKKACEITDQIFSKLIKNFNKFKSEKEVARFILNETKKRNLRPSFPPIVGTGKNASEIHHKPGKDWNKGFCVMDFGVRVNGYCSDMTRTVYIGKPTKKEKQLYQLLLNAQMKGIKLAKPGITGKEISKLNLKLLGKHKNKMIHGLGHGVGKHIHMKPSLTLRSNDIIKKGDILTIEPGIYHKGRYGMRIEDTILIPNHILTKSTKKLISLNP